MKKGNHLILLVDDEEEYLLLMKLTLQKEGYDVEVSSNGQNIIDKLINNKPDIILLDVKMNGVDGATICHLLKDNDTTHNIPIYLVSGNADVKKVSQECHADGFISKPPDITKIKVLIKKILLPAPDSHL